LGEFIAAFGQIILRVNAPRTPFAAIKFEFHQNAKGINGRAAGRQPSGARVLIIAASLDGVSRKLPHR
jgi:hypothetical protein